MAFQESDYSVRLLFDTWEGEYLICFNDFKFSRGEEVGYVVKVNFNPPFSKGHFRATWIILDKQYISPVRVGA